MTLHKLNNSTGFPSWFSPFMNSFFFLMYISPSQILLQHMLGIICFQLRAASSSGFGFRSERTWPVRLSRLSTGVRMRTSQNPAWALRWRQVCHSSHFYLCQNSWVSQHKCKQGRRCLQPSFSKRGLSEKKTLTPLQLLSSFPEQNLLHLCWTTPNQVQPFQKLLLVHS